MGKIIFKTEKGSEYSILFEKIKNINQGNIWTLSFFCLENKGDVFSIFNNLHRISSSLIKDKKVEVLLIYVESNEKDLNKKTNVFIRWIKKIPFLKSYEIIKNPLMKRMNSIKSINTNLIIVNINAT